MSIDGSGRAGDRRAGIGLALMTAVISGVAVFVNSDAVRAFGDATAYTTVKNGVAALVLLGVLAAASARRSPVGWTPPADRWQWAGLVAVGVIGGSIPFVLFFEGLSRAAAPDAALIHKSLVVWVAVLAVVLLRERIGWLQVAAIGVLLAGQGLLGLRVDALALGGGEAMILGATLLWAVETVIAKRLLSDLSPLTVGVARLGLGLVVLVGWLAVGGAWDSLLPASPSAWWWAVATGFVLAAYVGTWYAALSRAPAVDVTAVLVLGAVITALLAAALRDAALAPKVVGLALIVAGVVAVVLAPGAPRARDRTEGAAGEAP